MKPWQAAELAACVIVLAIGLAFWRSRITPEDRLACTNLYEAARTAQDTLVADAAVVHESSTRAPRSTLMTCADIRRTAPR